MLSYAKKCLEVVDIVTAVLYRRVDFKYTWSDNSNGSSCFVLVVSKTHTVRADVLCCKFLVEGWKFHVVDCWILPPARKLKIERSQIRWLTIDGLC